MDSAGLAPLAAIPTPSPTSPGGDTTPPTIAAMSVSPRTAAAGSPVTITARLLDLSGVSSVYVYYQLPNGSTAAVNGTFTLVAGTPQDGTWQAQFTIPATSASGTWTVNVVHIRDTASNQISITPPAAPTGDMTITVQ